MRVVNTSVRAQEMGSKTSPFGAFGDAISIGVLWCTYSSLTLLSPPANRYCKMGYAGNCEPSWPSISEKLIYCRYCRTVVPGYRP